MCSDKLRPKMYENLIQIYSERVLVGTRKQFPISVLSHVKLGINSFC